MQHANNADLIEIITEFVEETALYLAPYAPVDTDPFAYTNIKEAMETIPGAIIYIRDAIIAALDDLKREYPEGIPEGKITEALAVAAKEPAFSENKNVSIIAIEFHQSIIMKIIAKAAKKAFAKANKDAELGDKFDIKIAGRTCGEILEAIHARFIESISAVGAKNTAAEILERIFDEELFSKLPNDPHSIDPETIKVFTGYRDLIYENAGEFLKIYLP